MRVLKHQHFLLVTLVLCNAAATEALPIFIHRLADPITAVLLSVTVVLIFGEILPQSICSRYRMKVGAYSAWFVRALMLVCAPIAWPIGRVLDWALGHEQKALFRWAHLKVLVDLHGGTAGLGGTLSHDEINIIRGALDLTSKTARGGMTPLEKCFMLSAQQPMDEATLQAILDSGDSRIPVYRGSNRKDIMGLILVKELVGSLRMRDLPRLSAATPMYDLLKLFETGRSHMAVLTKSPDEAAGAGQAEMVQTAAGEAPLVQLGEEDLGVLGSEELVVLDGEAVGIITIEDVIEELLQEEIVHETDLYVDNLQTSKVNSAMLARSLPPCLRRVLSAGIFAPRIGRLAANPRKERARGARGGGGGRGGGLCRLHHHRTGGPSPHRGVRHRPLPHPGPLRHPLRPLAAARSRPRLPPPPPIRPPAPQCRAARPFLGPVGHDRARALVGAATSCATSSTGGGHSSLALGFGCSRMPQHACLDQRAGSVASDGSCGVRGAVCALWQRQGGGPSCVRGAGNSLRSRYHHGIWHGKGKRACSAMELVDRVSLRAGAGAGVGKAMTAAWLRGAA